MEMLDDRDQARIKAGAIHVIEYSALEAKDARIQELESELSHVKAENEQNLRVIGSYAADLALAKAENDGLREDRDALTCRNVFLAKQKREVDSALALANAKLEKAVEQRNVAIGRMWEGCRMAKRIVGIRADVDACDAALASIESGGEG